MTILKPKLCMAWVRGVIRVDGVVQNLQRHAVFDLFWIAFGN